MPRSGSSACGGTVAAAAVPPKIARGSAAVPAPAAAAARKVRRLSGERGSSIEVDSFVATGEGRAGKTTYVWLRGGRSVVQTPGQPGMPRTRLAESFSEDGRHGKV